MTPRRTIALAVFALAAAFARPAFADDAQTAAAAAAAQAVGGMATGGAAGGAGAGVGAGAGRGAGRNAGPGSGGHFQRALSAPSIPRANGGAKKIGKKNGRSAASKREAESKYKSRELVENSEHAYRFDENGNPVNASAAPAKKPAGKSSKKAASSSAADDKDEKPGACSTDEPCTVKNSDADAL
jgi:hypothetical protein